MCEDVCPLRQKKNITPGEFQKEFTSNYRLWCQVWTGRQGGKGMGTGHEGGQREAEGQRWRKATAVGAGRESTAPEQISPKPTHQSLSPQECRPRQRTPTHICMQISPNLDMNVLQHASIWNPPGPPTGFPNQGGGVDICPPPRIRYVETGVLVGKRGGGYVCVEHTPSWWR